MSPAERLRDIRARYGDQSVQTITFRRNIGTVITGRVIARGPLPDDLWALHW